jgi:hypothetical protein
MNQKQFAVLQALNQTAKDTESNADDRVTAWPGSGGGEYSGIKDY